jgi:hypothetical protein
VTASKSFSILSRCSALISCTMLNPLLHDAGEPVRGRKA